MVPGSEIGRGGQGESLFTVTANFTAEPILDVLQFWIEILSLGSARISFSGYNQVFQELVAPNSLLASSTSGVNFLLIRIEDWAKDQAEDLKSETVKVAGKEFINSLNSFAGRARRPTILLLCPPSNEASSNARFSNVIHSLTDEIHRAADRLRDIAVVSANELAAMYPVAEVDDPESNFEGHIPFTRSFWVAAGTMLMRKSRAFLHSPLKVIAIDADNTLWGGIVAEVGSDRVQIDGEWCELQQILKDQKNLGMLLVLASKNQERDVEEVFRRPGMILQRGDFADWKVDWNPKSENLRATAASLNLGLDSFVFLDDNPMECAEVAARCPTITVLMLPTESHQIPSFLRHLWAFDLPAATTADRNRTEQYQDQATRNQFQSSLGSYREFIEKLELKLDMTSPTPEQFDRAAQLTQRTNQFNATNVRRTSTEMGSLITSGARQALLVRVRDRFGDYGDVGLGIYWISGDDLNVENFLLSCRVLGKGIEHRLLSQMGRIADELGKKRVVIPFKRTERNEPAAKFFEAVGGAFREGDVYRIPVSHVRDLVFEPEHAYESVLENDGKVRADKGNARIQCDFGEIARRLTTVPDIQRAIRLRYGKSRPALDVPFAAPRNAIEQELAENWEDALGLDRVGIYDNFFDLGGDSVLSIQIIARANQSGFRLNLRQFFESPTISGLAGWINGQVSASEQAESDSSNTQTPEFSLSKLSPKSLSHILENLAKGRK